MPAAPQALGGLAATTDLEFASPRKKGPLIIGAVAGGAALIGIVIAITSSGPPPAPPPAPAVVAPQPTQTIETRPNTMPDTVPQPVQPSTGTSTPVEGGKFSDLFAEGLEKAGGAETGSGKFDEKQAKKAVAAVLKKVATCKEAGGSIGQTSAAITFSSNGTVSSVTVGEPFSGTSTGTCIIGALKEAKMPPFSGLPGTVNYPLSIR
jgi:hypothetical protein